MKFHISKKVLWLFYFSMTAPGLISGAALTLAGASVGFKKVGYDRIPQVAVLSAGFFAVSHAPVGPASVHLPLDVYAETEPLTMAYETLSIY